MGLFSGLMGNATEIDLEKVENEFEKILGEGESIEAGYKVIRDLYIFTNKRLVLVDKQGVTGKKVEYHSIPYRSISHFSVESTGYFDLEAELKIWITGNQEPIIKEFRKDKNIYDVQRALASFSLK